MLQVKVNVFMANIHYVIFAFERGKLAIKKGNYKGMIESLLF